MKQKLEESIDRAPPGYFHPKVKEKLPEAKQRLSKIADLIDDLGRLDECTQEVYVDENSLRKLLRETSPGSEEPVLAQLKRFPGSKLTDRGDGMKKIPWETLPVDANPIAVGQYPTFDEIRSGVRGRYPNIPEKAFEAEDMNRAFKAAIQAPGAVGEGEGLGRNFLDCMWAPAVVRDRYGVGNRCHRPYRLHCGSCHKSRRSPFHSSLLGTFLASLVGAWCAGRRPD